jgi:hypothetical protein
MGMDQHLWLVYLWNFYIYSPAILGYPPGARVWLIAMYIYKTYAGMYSHIIYVFIILYIYVYTHGCSMFSWDNPVARRARWLPAVIWAIASCCGLHRRGARCTWPWWDVNRLGHNRFWWFLAIQLSSDHLFWVFLAGSQNLSILVWKNLRGLDP